MAYYTMHCIDHPGVLATRLATVPLHRDYLDTKPITILISGPLLDTDEQTMIGSFFLLEAENLEEVMRFHHADPFFKSGIWKEVRIHPFFKRQDNRG